ncbi:MAG TPA: hypothetical protein VGV63_01180 [Acidimicrobiales bacterium]|nr:hypothetical protein [Acidimicrobiales bacterium]
MLRTAVLAVHVAAGGAGLVLGPLAMGAAKVPGRHTRAGTAYQAAVAVVAASAVALATLAWARLWALAMIAVATEAAAVAGWWLARRRPTGWLPWHVRLLCGSYVSLVTALLVVNWSSPLGWVAPTIVGSPLIAVAAHRTSKAAAPKAVAQPPSACATGIEGR